METKPAGTIDDLVQDASNAGFEVTPRLIRSWTTKGLLDHPIRQPRGRGKGSRPALYRGSQRELFLVLQHHRARELSLPGLARIPVALWLYWPDAAIPADQARRAFTTWLDDPRSSRDEARRNARAVTAQLATVRTTAKARRTLTNILSDLAYRGELDDEAALRQAIREVFEPEYQGIAKTVGHPDAPLSTDAMVDIIRANLAGAWLVTSQRLTLPDFVEAGRRQRESMAEYIHDQPQMTSIDWGQPAGLYEQPSVQWLVEQCCSQLLTIIGLRAVAGGSRSR